MQGKQGSGFLLLLQGFDDQVELAFEDVGEGVEGEVDAMVGEAALRVVVGADAFRAVARADQGFALRRLRALRFLPFGVKEARGKQAHGFGAVFVLRAFFLAFDDGAGGQVGDADGGVGFVDVLAACAARAVGVDAQVCGVDVYCFDVFAFGEDGDGGGGGVDAAAAFGFGDALYAVRAGFEFEGGIDVLPGDAADDFFVAAVFAGVFGEYFELPAFAFRVFVVHAKEVAREDGGFVAAGAGADFEVDVGFVERIFGDHQAFERFFASLARGCELRAFFAGKGGEFGVVLEGVKGSKFVIETLEFLVLLDDGGELREFLAIFAQEVAAPGCGRVSQQMAEFFMTLAENGEFGKEGRVHQCLVSVVKVSAMMASQSL